MSTANHRQQAVAELNQIVRDIGNVNTLLVTAIAERIGLSASEFECCSLIQDAGPFTAGELARRCHLTTGGMTGMIDRLERAGFVRREHDSRDRRRVLVHGVYKRDAVQKVIAMYRPLQNMFDTMLSTYSDEQIDLLLDYNRKLIEMFRETCERLPEQK